MVKSEKFDHLHLVYHSTVPLTSRKTRVFISHYLDPINRALSWLGPSANGFTREQ